MGISSDSVHNHRSLKKAQRDSSSLSKSFAKSVRPKGVISIGAEYGVLPFISGGNFPTGGFKTEGNIRLNVWKFPIQTTFFYSSYKNILGLNNYFRISFDADQYKDQMLEKLPEKEKMLQQQLLKLQSQKQQLSQQIAYIDHIKNLQKDYKLPDFQEYQPNITDSADGFSEGILSAITHPQTPIRDTAAAVFYDPKRYTSSQYQSYKDSLFENAYGIVTLDSLNANYSTYKSTYDSLNERIDRTKAQLEKIRQLKKDPYNANPYNSKLEQFLGGIKKFEIGLCYPSYSTFLVQNMPVKGINVEFSKRERFIAFTYGTTVNNLLFVPSNIQGTFQNVQNLYNYFDFNNLENGRKIISFKTGVGDKNKSHLFVGALIGIGKSNFGRVEEVGSFSGLSRENNLVIEVDAKQIIRKNISVDLVAGKSAVKDGNLTYNSLQQNVSQIFSDFRSNAVLTRGNINIIKTKTAVTLIGRWIDPLFRSFGTGFLRADNFRFDVKAEQIFTPKIKVSVGVKREEDNLLRLYNYTNSLYAINMSLAVKLNRRLNIRTSYYPIRRNLSSPGKLIRTKNSISNLILTFIPKCKNGDIQSNLIYNYYLVSTDSQQIDFQNIAFMNQYQFKNGFRFQISSSWFKNNLADSLNNNTILSVVDFGYVFKNNSTISLGGKMASKFKQLAQFGFVARSAIKIFKKYTLESSIEKIMPGDFYNGFNIDLINKFPYYCNSRIIIAF